MLTKSLWVRLFGFAFNLVSTDCCRIVQMLLFEWLRAVHDYSYIFVHAAGILQEPRQERL